MPIFSKQMFAKIDRSLTQNEQEEIAIRLKEIYGNDCLDYQDNAKDFDLCKQQLLTLLNYIYQLNPISLKLFDTFRDNVSKLHNDSPDIDIDCLLKATKKNIEYNLLKILNKHPTIDSNAFNHLTVNACYQGASSNINEALSHFNTSQLSFFIQEATSQCVQQLAKIFLNKHDLFGCPPSNEIHLINALLNNVSEEYGLTTIDDKFARGLKDNEFSQWQTYIATEFTVSYFLAFCRTSFQQPPNEDINNPSALGRFNHFFHLFGKKITEEVYLPLYKETDYLLRPRANFLFHYSCLLAEYLQEAGFIEGLTSTLNEITYFYNGEQLVKITDDRELLYQKLSAGEVLSLIEEPSLKSFQIWRQLNLSLLVSYYFEHPCDDYFNYFLNDCELPNNIVLSLFNRVDDEKKSQVAVYVFTHSYKSLEPEKLAEISAHIPPAMIDTLVQQIIKTDNIDYFNHLSKSYPDLLSQQSLIFSAASAGAIQIISYLRASDINLLDIDDNGDTVAHYAARKGHINLIIKLSE